MTMPVWDAFAVACAADAVFFDGGMKTAEKLHAIFGSNETSNPLWEVKQEFIRLKQHCTQSLRDDEDRKQRDADQAARRRLRADENARADLRAEKAGPPSWGRIDPAGALKAARNPREPEVGRFAQTETEPAHGVFYRGCVNEIHGESEGGKSWLAQFTVAQELNAGRVVAYVDYEDDEGSVYRRLKLLGVSDEVLLGDLFRYIRPNGPMTDAEKVTLLESAADADTVIFDGVTEGMSLEGLNGRIEMEVAAWHAKVTKDLAHAGKCVVVIDHTPHDGNRTIGSQHKKACISGVSYLVDPVQPIGAGQRGVLRLRVEKDRPSSVRREAAPGARPQWRGDLVVDFSEGRVQPDVALFPASPREDGGNGNDSPPEELLRAILNAVDQIPGCGVGAIRGAVKGDNTKVDYGREWLIAHGHIRREKEGNKTAHYIGPAPFDPSADQENA